MPEQTNGSDLFEIIKTTRSMRRLKPDPVPNEMIRKILEAGVCAPSGGNMQRWRFLVIRDDKIKETVGGLYKHAWDEQVAPRHRAGEPAPGRSQERFLRLLAAAEYLAAHIHETPVALGRRDTDPDVRLVHIPRSSEHAAGGTSARPWRDIDHALFAVREGSRGRSGPSARFPFVCLRPIGYPLGRFGPVRRIALADVVYEDQWASVPRFGSGNAPYSWISRFLYPWRSAANYPPERNPFNLKGRTGLCLAALSWLGPFPAIPQWKCPIVPRPRKIMLSNATSPTGIEKGSSPVRGLWSEPRPLVVTSKLSLPIIWCDRRSPIFHLASPEPSVRAPFGFVFSENDP
jgi:nitroreductase